LSRIRIVGGAWRSRLIDVRAHGGLRPTPDRVRETLFNWLGQDLGGLSCVDLFAGSGVLGFEAASRGASPVTLVEHDRAVFDALRRAGDALGASGVEFVCGDAVKFAASSARRYDLVMLDPPYGQGWLQRIEPHLQRIAQADGQLYVEAEAVVEQLGAWVSVKRGRAGQVHFQLLQRRQP
jgi:16S rRNA (guanine(966)-N(2))-methyltransferase RsmD